MEKFIFTFGREEFHCVAGDVSHAKLKADNFVDREFPQDLPYGWVPVVNETNEFRMSMGA